MILDVAPGMDWTAACGIMMVTEQVPLPLVPPPVCQSRCGSVAPGHPWRARPALNTREALNQALPALSSAWRAAAGRSPLRQGPV